MAISELNLIEGAGDLQEMLRTLREGGEEQLGQAAAQGIQPAAGDKLSISIQAKNASSNMMARNFSSADSGESKYVSAMKDARAAEQQVTMSRNSIIVAAVADAIKDAAFWYGDERMRNAKQLKDSVESNAENFKQIRDNIEEKAAEAVENSGQDVSEGAQMPEIATGGGSSSTPAPAPEVASAQAVAAATPAPAAPSAPSPATPSVDVVV